MRDKLVDYWTFLSEADGKDVHKLSLEELADMAIIFLQGKI